MSRYIKVAVSGPLRKSFTYKLPDQFENLSPGQRILVPFGNKKLVGFYLSESKKPVGFKTKHIAKILDEHSLFKKELFDLIIWMSEYYFANPADCLSSALPPLLKKNISPTFYWSETEKPVDDLFFASLFKPGKRISKAVLDKIKSSKKPGLDKLLKDEIIIEKYESSDVNSARVTGYKPCERELWEQYFENNKFKADFIDSTKSRSQLIESGWSDYQIKKAVANKILFPVTDENDTVLEFIQPKKDLKQISLTESQQKIVDDFSNKSADGFKTSLLHGVTGSGKTIVYCHIVNKVIESGKTALIMTPEIALTSTTLAYFRGFFGDNVTVLHSAMTNRERLNSFNGIRNGKYKIVVGPRSALFAPLDNLGIIIVDEEHDSSYKQDDPAPRFHGRDSAIMRAKLNDVPIILGSASPSFESYHNAKSGRYDLYELTERPAGSVLPSVRIVDMKYERLHGDLPYLSYTLKKEIDQRLTKDEQAILFLNRRGYSPQIRCADCGHKPTCPECRIKLTYHKKGNKLSCHYCGYTDNSYDVCEKCNGHSFLYPGSGTQKLEEDIARLFKDSSVLRLDSDSAEGRRQTYEILTDFASGKSKLLIGTQMVTKGLDIPGVTLVGVMSADLALELPDFRASEKAFARLLQVAGRSGRSEKRGEVLIQTYDPENPVIVDASRQDYTDYYEREIKDRKDLWYPPFSRVVNFVLLSKDEKELEKLSLHFRNRLDKMVELYKIKADILGPAPCPIYFLRSHYRRHLFVKTNQVTKLTKMLTDWEDKEPKFKLPANIRLNIDVDPDDMM